MAIHDMIGERIESLACSQCGTVMNVSFAAPFSVVRCTQCGLEISVPKKLGAFLLLKFLGKGGMGAVFLGYDPKLGRQCAIKVLGDVLGDDPSAVDNFLREARAAAQINSPNVVQIYQVGEQNNIPFIVMELISGGQLDKMIEEQPLDELRALEVTRDAASGLLAAQAIGFFHGDIKPENILFDHNQVAKIADFGLAQFLQRGKKSKPGEIWGTPYYIAPEKARRQQEDYRSDIYSLGATLFHAITGQPPFEGETAAEVVIARLKSLAPDVRELRPELHDPTSELIARMLDPDPARRYPNYTSLLSDIDEVIRKVKQAKRDESLVGIKKQKKKKRLVLALVLVLLAALPVLFFLGGERPEIPRKQDELIEMEVISWSRNSYRYQQAALYNVDQKMRTIASTLPPEHRGRSWAVLLRGSFFALARNFPEMSNTLSLLAGQDVPPELDGVPNPDYMPVRLAAFMLGTNALLSTPDGQWPDWYVAISDYMAGVKALTMTEFEIAQRHLDKYLARPPGSKEQQWPYSFRPMAAALTEDLRRWLTREAQIDRMIERDMIERAIESLDRADVDVPPIFAPFVERNRARLGGVGAGAPGESSDVPPPEQADEDQPPEQETGHLQQEQEEETLRKKEEAEARKRAREEKARIKEEEERRAAEMDQQAFAVLKTDVLSALRQREFSKAEEDAERRGGEMKTDDGRAKVAKLKEMLSAIRSLNEEVISLLGRVALPSPINRGLGGPPKSANEREIIITLTHGEIAKPWNTINNPNYVQLAEAVITNSRLSAAEKARHYMAMALFMRAIGAPERRITPYEELAVGADSAIQADIDAYTPLFN